MYEWHHKVAFIWVGGGGKQQSQAVSLGIYPDTFPPPSRCRICAFFPSDAGNTADGKLVQSLPVQTALSGGHRASLAARPLHGDSAGFNYPQLCFISLPSWALCPGVL